MEMLDWVSSDSHLLVAEESVTTLESHVECNYVVSDSALDAIPTVSWSDLAALADYLTNE